MVTRYKAESHHREQDYTGTKSPGLKELASYRLFLQERGTKSVTRRKGLILKGTSTLKSVRSA